MTHMNTYLMITSSKVAEIITTYITISTFLVVTTTVTTTTPITTEPYDPLKHERTVECRGWQVGNFSIQYLETKFLNDLLCCSLSD